MSEEKKYHFETLQLHVGQEQADPATDSRAVPIYQTTSYVIRNRQHAADRFALKDAGNVYGRLTNPTEDVFEKRIAALEGGVAALATASGAAAVTYAMQALVHAGQHIVCATTVYGGTYNLFEHTFPDFGIETTFVDPTKGVHVFEEAVRENTQAIYIESVGNPNANLIDIDAVAAIAHKHKIPLVVDSTFATPYLLRPFEHGADVVVHSATKFIGGHGTTLGGIIVDSGNSVVEQVEKQLNKLVDVIKVRTLEENSLIGRELMILKVNANNKTRQDIMTICEIMGAKVDDISPTSLTLELSDTPDRLDTFQSMMRPFSILEVARTGMVAVQKGAGKI